MQTLNIEVTCTIVFMFTGSSNSSLELKKVKPPNKKKHEDEIEGVQNEIKEKETQLVSFY